MAKRIVFTPTSTSEKLLFNEHLIEFEWVPGLAKSQNQKAIRNFHMKIEQQLGIAPILEISTKSEIQLGTRLSAFNLNARFNNGSSTVESLYQGSKVFEKGGPFTDLYELPSLQAKRDPRLLSSGSLLGFEFENTSWGLIDSPNFYDYLYIRALKDFEMSSELLEYQGFTDFAYSQNTLKKRSGLSFNCQARSAAIYVSLFNRNALDQYLETPKDFQIDSLNEQIRLFE
jgi:hypothetical protein